MKPNSDFGTFSLSDLGPECDHVESKYDKEKKLLILETLLERIAYSFHYVEQIELLFYLKYYQNVIFDK